MILKFLNASLKRRVLLMFMVIGLMLIIDMFIINHFQDKTDQHSKTLSIIYQSQSSVDQLSVTANKIFRENEFDIKDELLLTSSQISQNINLLIKGGTVPNTTLSIKPLVGDILNKTQDLLTDWQQALTFINVIHTSPIKVDSTISESIIKTELIDSTYQEVAHEINRIVLVPNPAIKDALTQFSSYKKLIFQDFNNLSLATISDFEVQKKQQKQFLFLLLLINLMIIGAFLTLMINAVIKPLGKIGYLTNKVANGEDVDIRYNKPDEIGEIVSSVKSLGNHLRQASDFVHHIGEGNLEVKLQGLDKEKDTQGSLANALVGMQNKLKSVSKEDQIRNWTTRGIAKFAEILRANDNDLNSLGDAILAELINYTEANIGCIYVPEETQDSTKLQLIAFYAYDTKKHFNESVEIGEGIIGQTFIEKKTTHLLEIPEDYTNIKSGVGTSSPKSILIIPLKVNEDIYGILEIASFKEFSEEEIDFIEKIGETIAGTIYNVKNAARTKKLLQESQELTEQMRAQEEEMRQNMEELSATQEEAARKELQTTSSIEAFDKAVATLEFDEDGIITNSNALLTELSGQSKNSILHQHLSSIISTTNDESIESFTSSFFERKQSLSENLDLILKEGNTLKINAHISLLQSGNALLICYPSNGSHSTPDKSITDIEEELTQNLNMLELTQEALNEKMHIIEHSSIYLEINSNSQIVSHTSSLLDIIDQPNANITKHIFTEIISLTEADKKNIDRHLSKHNYYNGIVTINRDNKTSKKIMLHIEQLNNKK